MQTLPFGELWKKHNPQTLEETLAFWEGRADSFNTVTHTKNKTERHALVDFLEQRGAIQPGFSVLDLGCGAGRFALELAPRAHSFVGLDISPKMIGHARQNAGSAGISNAEFFVLPWQEANLDFLGWSGAFDLAFAYMSPAIDSEEALLKMHAASRRYCFLSGFIRRSDTLFNEVLGRLAPELDLPPHMGGVIYAFNVLWQHGIYADLLCRDNDWADDWDVPTALAAYAGDVKKLLPDRAGIDEELERELRALASNGKLCRRMTSKVAWLFWKV